MKLNLNKTVIIIIKFLKNLYYMKKSVQKFAKGVKNPYGTQKFCTVGSLKHRE